ncbi:MAG: hypothetical protein ABN482_06240 [Corticimicrobacter sp.]|uniref:hypothetical protein n=1 Tax=Corticimicrobacter sp. TaxID=2678536 RepID=UPI0032DA0BD6
MYTDSFLSAVQTRAARISVSASAVRKQGEGIVDPAREFFNGLDLKQFAVQKQEIFQKCLDEATDALRNRLPNPQEGWGIARKLTNIFLRDALYTTYLRDKFELHLSEAFLEVPLDSISARRIYECTAAPRELQKWKGVKYNNPENNLAYQLVAKRIADKAQVARVHLDTYWWGMRIAAHE